MFFLMYALWPLSNSFPNFLNSTEVGYCAQVMPIPISWYGSSPGHAPDPCRTSRRCRWPASSWPWRWPGRRWCAADPARRPPDIRRVCKRKKVITLIIPRTIVVTTPWNTTVSFFCALSLTACKIAKKKPRVPSASSGRILSKGAMDPPLLPARIWMGMIVDCPDNIFPTYQPSTLSIHVFASWGRRAKTRCFTTQTTIARVTWLELTHRGANCVISGI